MINRGSSLTQWCEQLGSHRPLYMAVIDAEMQLSFVNSHFYRSFQQIAMPDSHRSFGSLIDEQDLEKFKVTMKERLGKAGETAIRVRMKHGLGKWVQWHLRPLEKLDVGGRLLCLGYDVAKVASAAMPQKRDPKAVRAKKLADSILDAQQRERARIGQELHDNITQILTSAHLYMSCLQRESRDFDHIKGKAMEIILQAVDEIRQLSREMVLPDFRLKGLIHSIEDMIGDLSHGDSPEITFWHADLLTIESQDQQLRLTLYRILQAQIRNILKHSSAKHVVISLDASNEQVRLQIQDDGFGFDPVTTKHGLGLGGIYERAAIYGGKVTLDAAPGKGCSLIVTIPLELKRII
jgi:signal transduction histidine kinase